MRGEQRAETASSALVPLTETLLKKGNAGLPGRRNAAPAIRHFAARAEQAAVAGTAATTGWPVPRHLRERAVVTARDGSSHYHQKRRVPAVVGMLWRQNSRMPAALLLLLELKTSVFHNLENILEPHLQDPKDRSLVFSTTSPTAAITLSIQKPLSFQTGES
jgi:hypothetical protein